MKKCMIIYTLLPPSWKTQISKEQPTKPNKPTSYHTSPSTQYLSSPSDPLALSQRKLCIDVRLRLIHEKVWDYWMSLSRWLLLGFLSLTFYFNWVLTDSSLSDGFLPTELTFKIAWLHFRKETLYLATSNLNQYWKHKALFILWLPWSLLV